MDRKNKFYKTWLYKTGKKKYKSRKHGKVICRNPEGQIIRIYHPEYIEIAETFQGDQRRSPTKAESHLIKHLKPVIKQRFGLNILDQHIIHSHHTFYILDIYIPKYKVAVEVDGRHP